MCLIITGPANKIRETLLNTKGMLADIFDSNEDGLGVMYKNKRGLRVVKRLPKSLIEVERMIETLPDDDRNLAMHWRMRTHGDIDLANCHPYDVLPGQLAMMHNGVLKTGNDADKTKSDTWHFIEDFLVGPTTISIDLVHDESFGLMLGDFIGASNKFVFMDDAGRLSVINRSSGVEFGDLWFSNTYAWSPELLIPGHQSRRRGGYYGHWSSVEWEDESFDSWMGRGTVQTIGTPPVAQTATSTAVAATVNPHNPHNVLGTDLADAKLLDAVLNSDVDYVRGVLRAWPYSALGVVLRWLKPVLGKWAERPNGVTTRERRHLDAIMSGDQMKYGKCSSENPTIMSEVMCYYLEWEERSSARPRLPEEVVDVRATTVAEPDAAPEQAANEDKAEPSDTGEPAVFFNRTEYQNSTIVTYEDPTMGCWCYVTLGPDGSQDDEGYGYEEEQEAIDWAKYGIDIDLSLDNRPLEVLG